VGDVDQAYPYRRRPGALSRRYPHRMRRLRIGADDERGRVGGSVRGRATGGGTGADKVRAVRGEGGEAGGVAAGLSTSSCGAYQGPGNSPDRADAMAWALRDVGTGG
jgi:hypothetical protein